MAGVVVLYSCFFGQGCSILSSVVFRFAVWANGLPALGGEYLPTGTAGSRNSTRAIVRQFGDIPREAADGEGGVNVIGASHDQRASTGHPHCLSGNR